MAVISSCHLKSILRLNTFKSGLKYVQLRNNNKNLFTCSNYVGTSFPLKCLSTSSSSVRLLRNNSGEPLCLGQSQRFYSCLISKGHNSGFMTSILDEPSCSKRILSSASTPKKEDINDEQVSTVTGNEAQLSTKDKLKKAVKEYGATVIVFHVIMSLTSLGISYALVSSGLDVVALLEWMGVGKSILESKITQGASTFVVAYAFHKVFAPVRITITLTATPLIVRYLRGIGFLKKPPAT